MDFSTLIRLDRHDEGGDIIIYIRFDIPYKILKNCLPNNIEGLYIEINLRNKKMVIIRKIYLIFFGGYNPNKENILYFCLEGITPIRKIYHVFWIT